MSWQRDTHSPSAGVSLNYFHNVPKGKLKGVVHINHGLAEHAQRYETFAHDLAKAGYASYVHDHRGHGATVAPGASIGSFGDDGWNGVIADVYAMNQLAKINHPDVPTIVFGHSMGGILTLSYLMTHPESVSAAALWNFGVEAGVLGFVLKSILKVQRMFLGSDVPSGLVKAQTFEAWNKKFAPNRTEFDWLSRDEAQVDKYVADPLCGFDSSIALWLELVGGIYFGADNNNLAKLPNTLPIHLQGGEKDPCSEYGTAVAKVYQRMQSAGMTDVTFNLLADTRHESLNEINRDETVADFIAWLDKRFG